MAGNFSPGRKTGNGKQMSFGNPKHIRISVDVDWEWLWDRVSWMGTRGQLDYCNSPSNREG